jgi:hypothetical protein
MTKGKKKTAIKNETNFLFWLASTYPLSMVKMAVPAPKS